MQVLGGKEYNEIFHLGSGFEIACRRLKLVEKISGNTLQQQLIKSKSKHASTLLWVPKAYKIIIKKEQDLIINKSKYKYEFKIRCQRPCKYNFH